MQSVFSTKLPRLLALSTLGLGLLLGSGCSKSGSDDKDVLTSNDFDHLDGWAGDVPSLTRDKAHSGAYSVMVKPGMDYSLGYSNPLGRLSLTRPDKIRVSGWILRAGDQNAAKLVIEITDPITKAAILWDGIDLGKEAPKVNTWQHIEHDITVPPTASATSIIKAYLWRTDANQPTYLDDLTISQIPK